MPFAAWPVVAALVAALVAAVLAGCGGSAGEGDAPPGGSRFGANYEILTSELPGAPEEPPALRGDTLAAAVAYPGGGDETHDFTLGHETQRDTARLWMRHDAAGDDDSTRVLDDVRLPVPAEALDAPTVVLLNPQGGAPFVLKWAGE